MLTLYVIVERIKQQQWLILAVKMDFDKAKGDPDDRGIYEDNWVNKL